MRNKESDYCRLAQCKRRIVSETSVFLIRDLFRWVQRWSYFCFHFCRNKILTFAGISRCRARITLVHLSLSSFPFVSQLQDCLKSYGRGTRILTKRTRQWYPRQTICSWQKCICTPNEVAYNYVRSNWLIKVKCTHRWTSNKL